MCINGKALNIKALERQIELQKNLLKSLENELARERIPECPILLLITKETIQNTSNENDCEYIYVYYYADINEVHYVVHKSPEEFLPNYVDMRDFFKEMKWPETIPSNKDAYFDKILDHVIFTLKYIINELCKSNTTNTWKDIAHILKVLPDNCIGPKYEDIEKTGKKKVLEEKR